MNKKLWILLFSVVFCLIPILVISQSEEPELKFGENKIVYTPKYVDGKELVFFLQSMSDGIEDCNVDYFESFNTIVITAPKETIGMFKKLLEKYDRRPEKAILKCYLIKTSSKGHLDQYVLDAIKPALDQLKQFDLKNGFELIGSSTMPLLVNKNRERFSTLLGTEPQLNINYELTLENILLTSETITIGELSLVKANASHNLEDENLDYTYDNVVNGSFTSSFGESTVIIKGTKSNAIILIFILEKIKS